MIAENAILYDDNIVAIITDIKMKCGLTGIFLCGIAMIDQ